MLISLLFPPASGIAQDRDDELQRCDHPIGTLAVLEPQSASGYLQRYGLDSPTSLIRMMTQQSNCFVVVERGPAFNRHLQERDLASDGTLRQDSNIGDGQMYGADFYLTPDVLFTEGNSGGVGLGAVGPLLGRRGRKVAGVLGGLKFQEAQTTLILTDTRSGVQVTAAQGKAKKADFKLGALGIGGGGGLGAGGYTNTNEGKVIAASFLDNYNKIVTDIRSNPALRDRSVNQDPAVVEAGAVFQAGDMLRPKLDNVKIVAAPEDDAQETATVMKADDLVFLGEEESGFLHVQSSSTGGWIKKLLVEKR